MDAMLSIGKEDTVKSIETIQAIDNSIALILDSGQAESVKTKALDVLVTMTSKLCKVENVNISNNTFTNKDEHNVVLPKELKLKFGE